MEVNCLYFPLAGKYFGDCYEQTPLPKAVDKEVAEKLWTLSVDMTELES